MAVPMHETVSQETSASMTRVVTTVVMQGAYDELVGELKQLTFDCEGGGSSSLPVPDGWGSAATCTRACDARLSRTQAGRGVLSVTYEATRSICAWGIDFTEVQKDIRTWRQGEEEEGNRPDLSVIASWEALKGDAAHSAMYANLKYYENGAERKIGDGPTKQLAEMMLRGVESYSIWIPVVSCQATSFNPGIVGAWGPVGANLGRISAPTATDEMFDKLGGIDVGTILSGLSQETSPAVSSAGKERKWILTADRMTMNGDGSFTRNLQWTGFGDVEQNLYGSAGS